MSRVARPQAPWLWGVGLALLVALMSLAWMQARQITLLTHSIRQMDNTSGWFFFQAEAEALRLVAALDATIIAPSAQTQQEWVERHEIFVSRIDLMDPSHQPDDQLIHPQHESTWKALQAWVPRADALRDHPEAATPRLLGTLRDELYAQVQGLHTLSVAANQITIDRQAERNEAVRTLIRMGLATTGLLAALTLAFAVVIARQWRASVRRSAELESLAERLRLAREAADSANQAKSAFLATMSHELRTPFHGLLGMLDLMGERPLDKTQRHYLHTARDSAKHLLTILNDILDLSRLESERLALCMGPVDLHQLLADVRAVMSGAAQAKDLRLDLSLQPGLPRWVQADDTRLRQVLFNLLSNAIKFTHHGHVRLDVKLNGGVDEQERLGVIFEVTDTGIGMDEQTLGRLFHRFSQGDDSIARRYGGTGLGLEISRSLTRLMEGDIRVDSQPGIGSRFTVTVPLTPALGGPAEVAPTSVADAALPLDTENTARVLDILIVEDNATNRMYLCTLLEHLGHHTRVAEDGEQALSEAQRQLPDVILMDVHMPVLDGLSATRILRQRTDALASVPVVALTADAFETARAAALAAGMNEVLVKPFDSAALRRLLTQFFGPQRTLPSATAYPEGADDPTQASEQQASPLSRPESLETSGAATQLMDFDAMAQACQMFSLERVQGLLANFLSDKAGTLTQLEHASQQQHTQAVMDAAHQLKGAASLLGLHAISRQASLLETAAQGAADTPVNANDVRRLRELWAETHALCHSLGFVPRTPGETALTP